VQTECFSTQDGGLALVQHSCSVALVESRAECGLRLHGRQQYCKVLLRISKVNFRLWSDEWPKNQTLSSRPTRGFTRVISILNPSEPIDGQFTISWLFQELQDRHPKRGYSDTMSNQQQGRQTRDPTPLAVRFSELPPPGLNQEQQAKWRLLWDRKLDTTLHYSYKRGSRANGVSAHSNLERLATDSIGFSVLKMALI